MQLQNSAAFYHGKNYLQQPPDHLVHRHLCAGDGPQLHKVVGFEAVLLWHHSSPNLAIWGLRKLQVNKVKGQLPEQSVTICGNNNNDKEDLLEVHNKDRQMLAHISFLDTSLFNGYSLLKSYSVENISSIMKHFPSLLYSDVFSTSDNESYVVTFIY